ncbi:MAG TPA: alpha/beta hydrolase [Parafilimonas sp.]|nr:alpha/beta hydrolase [Parafilimonas sp.]
MKTIYCIPGLGADEKCFQYLDLSFAETVFINWIQPFANETLHHYAMRIKQHFIHEKDPVIFGLSLGGMIAVEIAKAMPSAKVVIISSAKTKNEIPFYWKMFQYIPVYKILPEWSVKHRSRIRNYFLGTKKRRTKKYINDVALHADIKFYRWAIGAILTWQNETLTSNITHIHGTDDKLLPFRFIKADVAVNNGGHLMIIDNAEEISKLVKSIVMN